MATSELGKLEDVPVRKVWEDEALDFTPWLAENITLLGETLDMELDVVQQEASVGDFSLDILAKNEDGVVVAIENQLGWTDHDHLGKVLVYAAGYNACILIWITPEFRQEHYKALEWLERWTPDEVEVYGVELRAARIGESLPAPMLVPKFFPMDAWAERKRRRLGGIPANPDNRKGYKFFQPLVYRLWQGRFVNKQVASGALDHEFSIGISDLAYRASLEDKKAWVYTGRSGGYVSPRYVTDGLRAGDKELMQKELGLDHDHDTNIVWNTGRTRNIGVCREYADLQGRLIDNPDLHEEIREWMYEYLLKFRRVFNPQILRIVGESENSDK